MSFYRSFALHQGSFFSLSIIFLKVSKFTYEWLWCLKKVRTVACCDDERLVTAREGKKTGAKFYWHTKGAFGRGKHKILWYFCRYCSLSMYEDHLTSNTSAIWSRLWVWRTETNTVKVHGSRKSNAREIARGHICFGCPRLEGGQQHAIGSYVGRVARELEGCWTLKLWKKFC